VVFGKGSFGTWLAYKSYELTVGKGETWGDGITPIEVVIWRVSKIWYWREFGIRLVLRESGMVRRMFSRLGLGICVRNEPRRREGREGRSRRRKYKGRVLLTSI
jgi:hypothetical protein